MIAWGAWHVHTCSDVRRVFTTVISLIPRPNFLRTQQMDGQILRDHLSVHCIN